MARKLDLNLNVVNAVLLVLVLLFVIMTYERAVATTPYGEGYLGYQIFRGNQGLGDASLQKKSLDNSNYEYANRSHDKTFGQKNQYIDNKSKRVKNKSNVVSQPVYNILSQ